jgi:hypothetical protein
MAMLLSTALFAQGGGNGNAVFVVYLLFEIALAVLIIAGMWKVFEKAGQPGWAAIIPIYNAIVMLQIAGKPIWWIILLLIPCVNIIILIVVTIDLAKKFDQSALFGIGLALLGFIFWPILGFGSAQYRR